MKTRRWKQIFIIVIILAFTTRIGPAMAAPTPAETLTSPITSWWQFDFVDQPSDVGSYAAIAFDPGSGVPWISYYDASITALKVAHFVRTGGNCGPNNSWSCETVDNSGNVGMAPSIAVHPNTGTPPLNTRRVGVTYYDAGVGALKYAEYTCFMGCSWEIITIRDESYMGAPSYGEYSSLKYNQNGKPLIAFYAYSQFLNDEVVHAHQVPSGGNCGVGSAAGLWQCDTVDSGDRVGQYPSLDYNDFLGVVYIAYYDGGNGDLKYAYYAGIGNCGAGNTWYCSTVDGTDGSNVGKSVSFHAPANATDKLQFAYYDGSHGTMKYASHKGAGGNCGPGNSFQCDTIATTGGGLYRAISLAVNSSNVPMIAYQSSGGVSWTYLKVAQPAASLGLAEGNCGPGLVKYWQCYSVDSASASKTVATYASIDISLLGWAMIGYSELDTASNTYDLKVAYQQKGIFMPMIRKDLVYQLR